MPVHRPAWSNDVRVVELSEDGAVARALLRLRAQHDAARPVGLHCSSIVNDYVDTLYAKRKNSVFTHDTMVAFQEVGNLVEDILADALRVRTGWTKPEPRTQDGIICSPDGWQAATKTIHEMKATWVSERDFIDSPKLFKYALQSLDYAHVWKARRVQIHVFFINGNYRPPAPHLPRTFTLTWDDHVNAPAEMWRRTVQHARDRSWLPLSDC